MKKMYRKKSILILVMLALSLTLIPSVHAEYPIDNIVIVQDLPALVAGSTYEMIITFDNVAEAPIPIIVEINVTCEEAPLNRGEIIVESIYLNESELICTEIDPGLFKTEEAELEAESSNELTVTISSLINLMPGTYNFEINLLGEDFSYIIEVPANTPTTIDASGEAGVVLENFNSTEPATVTITLLDENPHPEAEVPPNSPMAMGIFFDFEANVTEFTTEIRVYYTDAQVKAAGIDEGSLRLYYFNGTLGEWVMCADTGVNTVENYIWANVTHFTVFSPWGVEETEPEEPDDDEEPPKNVKPVADAGLDQMAYVNETVYFDGAGSYDPDGRIVSYWWDFGDEEMAAGIEAQHVYLEPGNYTVFLTVVDNKGANGKDSCKITALEEVPPLKPAEFIVKDLKVSPLTVHPSDIVTITAGIENIGEEAGEHVVELLINGTLETSESVVLEGGESTTVTFFTVAKDVGVYLVEVDELLGSFTVIPEIEPLPAEFEFSNLTISPSTVYPKESVTIGFEVENIGEESGDYTVRLLINGTVEADQTITLAGEESTTVIFTVHKDVEGLYLVEVDGLEGSFMVESAPPPDSMLYLIAFVIIAAVIAIAAGFISRRRRP